IHRVAPFRDSPRVPPSTPNPETLHGRRECPTRGAWPAVHRPLQPDRRKSLLRAAGVHGDPLGPGPGEDLQAVAGDDARDGIEVGTDDRWDDTAAVAPVAEVPELLRIARRVVEGLAREGGVQGEIRDPPE